MAETKKRINPEGIVQSDIQVQLAEAIVKEAYLDLATYADKLDKGTVSAKSRAIKNIADKYNLQLEAWANITIPSLYYEGMTNAVNASIKAGQVYEFNQSFVSLHQEALEALISQSYTYTSKISQGIQDTGTRALTFAEQEKIKAEIGKGLVTGADQNAIAKGVASVLKQSQATAVVSVSGRKQGIDTYASTVARSILTDAQWQGTSNTIIEEGYDLVQVSDHFGECALCVLPDTKIKTKDLFSTTAIEYTGDMITIRTAGGNELTGTPDHTVLTDKGWLPLKALSKGDNVISDNGIGNWLSSISPNEINMESRIDKIGQSIRPFNFASPARRELDSNITYRKINIINADLFLLRKVDVGSSKALRKVFFVKAMRLFSLFFGKSNCKFSFKSLFRAFPFLMGWFYHSIFFFLCGVFPSFLHSVTPNFVKNFWIHSIKPSLDSMVPRSGLNSIIAKIVRYTSAGNAEEGTKLTARLAGLVKVDKITSLEVIQFSGHVYDLENKDNWYVSNNIISHNCRPYENEVLSLTGRTKGYTTLAEAKANGLQHANCRHSISPYTEGLADVSKVWDTETQSYQPKENVKSQNKTTNSPKSILRAYEQFTTKIGIKDYNIVNKAIKDKDVKTIQEVKKRTKDDRLKESLDILSDYIEK